MKALLRVVLLVTLLVASAGLTYASDTLEDFTFYITGQPGVNLLFEADVYAWNGTLTGGSGPQGAVGPALYTSPLMTYTGTGAFQPITISIPGGLALGQGSYVAFLTVSNPNGYGMGVGTTNWGDLLFQHVPGNGGGGFAFYNNNSCYACLNNGNWDDFADFGDLAWTAHFSGGVTFDTTYAWNGTSTIQPWGVPDTATYGQTFQVVPEPGSLALLGSGLVGVAGLLRRKLNLF